MTFKKIDEIMSALKRGATVQASIKGFGGNYPITKKDCNPYMGSTRLFSRADEDIIVIITEPQEPRLPNIDEVFQWFKDGKVFKSKKEPDYVKISSVSKDFKRINLVFLYGEWQSIKALVANFTDENGESLMIQD